MKKTLKKCLSSVICAVMLLNLVPMTVFGEEIDNKIITDVEQTENTLKEYRHTNPLYEGIEYNTISKNIQNYSLRSNDVDYTSDLQEIATDFRKQLVDRENTIDLYYHCNEDITQEFFNNLAVQLFQEAIKHTGIADEGDYIKWHYQGWSVDASYSAAENGGYNMHLTYHVAYLSDAAQEEEVNQAVSSLIQSLELTNKTDYQKVKAIYDYICSNISYDYDNLNDDAYTLKYTAYAALINKTSVCQGYASLFYRLSLEAGVDARVISGQAGEAHAWNIVKLGDKYYNLDSTWDAGNDPYLYFLKNMEDFSDHVRDTEYQTENFVAAYPVSEESYVEEEETEELFDVDNVEYKVLSESTVALWDAADVSGAFEIPSQVTYNNKTYSVAEIGYRAFYNNTKLTAVTMPDAVTKIQDGDKIEVSEYCGAFKGCTALKMVTFSENLMYIGKYSFSDDTELENIILPDKLETIMDESFEDCSSVTNINLPESVTYVGQHAFSGTSIVEFTIPKSCETFSDWALTDIPTLKSIYVEPGNSQYCSEDGILYTADMSWIVCYPSAKTDKKYRLPDQVTTIRAGVFDNPYLEELILNSRIDNSGLGTAMLQGTNISAIEVSSDNPYFISVNGVLFSKDGNTLILYPPNKPDSIYFVPSGTINIGEDGQYTFETCKNLEELYIPASVENIAGIMWDSEKIKQVVFASESKVTSLPGYIFQGCIGLETICLPKSINNLSDDFYGNEFRNCENLKVLYAAPDAGIYNCEYFGSQTLSGCSNLTVYGEGSSNALAQLAEEFGRPYQDVSQECDKVLGVTFKDTVQSITEGENISLNAVVYPKIKSDEILTYTSSDASIAKVDIDGNVIGIKEGICYITATSQDGAYARCQVQVSRDEETEGEIQIITQPVDFTGKVGDTAQFTVEAIGDGLVYQWQYYNKGSNTWKDSSMTGAQTNQIKVNITEGRIGQKYRCVITDGSGNTATTDEAQILMEAQELKITSQPEDYRGNVGETAVFTVEAEGEGLTYHWQYCNKGSNMWKDSSMTGAHTNQIKVNITENRIGQKYRCVITDGSGNTVTTDEAQILMEAQELKITSQPEDYKGNVGETAVFTVEAEGEGLTYQWQYCNKESNTWKNSSMTGARTNQIKVNITEGRIGQKYRCVITDGSGNTVTTDEARILMEAQELKITSQPEDYRGNVGETAVFTVEAEGEGLTYQWQYCNKGSNMWKDSSMTGAHTNQIKVNITENRIRQKYRCVITDGSGNTMTTDEAQILMEAQELKITSQPEDYKGNVGETAVFTVEAEGEGLTYKWQYCNKGSNMWKISSMTGARTNQIKVNITESRIGQKYRCVITDGSGNTVTTNEAQIALAN